MRYAYRGKTQEACRPQPASPPVSAPFDGRRRWSAFELLRRHAGGMGVVLLFARGRLCRGGCVCDGRGRRAAGGTDGGARSGRARCGSRHGRPVTASSRGTAAFSLVGLGWSLHRDRRRLRAGVHLGASAGLEIAAGRLARFIYLCHRGGRFAEFLWGTRLCPRSRFGWGSRRKGAAFVGRGI